MKLQQRLQEMPGCFTCFKGPQPVGEQYEADDPRRKRDEPVRQTGAYNPLFRGLAPSSYPSSEASSIQGSSIPMNAMGLNGLLPCTPKSQLGTRTTSPFLESKTSRSTLILSPYPNNVFLSHSNPQDSRAAAGSPTRNARLNNDDMQNPPSHCISSDDPEQELFYSCQGSFTSMKSADSEFEMTVSITAKPSVSTLQSASQGAVIPQSATPQPQVESQRAGSAQSTKSPPQWDLQKELSSLSASQQPQSESQGVMSPQSVTPQPQSESRRAVSPTTPRVWEPRRSNSNAVAAHDVPATHSLGAILHRISSSIRSPRHSHDLNHGPDSNHLIPSDDQARASHRPHAAGHAEQIGDWLSDLDDPENGTDQPPVSWSDGGEHVEMLKAAGQTYKKCRHPCRACAAIEAHCQAKHVEPVQLLRLLKSAPEQIEGVGKEDLIRLVKAAACMEAAKHNTRVDSDWELMLNKGEDLQMFYQHNPANTVHCFKGRTTLDAPTEHLMALAREFDLCQTWNKFCVESNVVKAYSEMELLCVAVQWMPWPLSNMNLVVEAVGTDLLHEMGAFLVVFHTPSNAKDPALYKALKHAKPKNLALHMLAGSGLLLEPLPALKPGGTSRTRATMCVRVDPGIKHVPHMIISWVLKYMGPFIHKIVVDLVKNEFANPNNPIPARIPTRPFLYGLVREHVAEYLADLEQKTKQQPQTESESAQETVAGH